MDKEIHEYQICACGHERGLHDEAGVCTKQRYHRGRAILCKCSNFELGDSDGLG